MKLKHFLLSTAAISALSASAEAIPVTFFPVANRSDIAIVGTNADGVFEYISEGADTRPTDEDGNPTGDFGNTIIGINKFEVPAPGSYVLAFDYKVNTDIFTYMGVRRTWDDGRSICTEMELQEAFEPNDEWLTYYVPFINTTEWDWISESWQDGKYEPYMILAQNNSNGKPGPFSLLIKNGRVMTNEEATAEINASSAEQPENIFPFHGLRAEFDDFTNSDYFTFDELAKNEDGTYAEQAIIGTNTRVLPINPKNNHFTFEYSVMDAFKMHVMAVMEGTEWFAREIGTIDLEASGDNAGFADSFKTAQVDLSEVINNDKFGATFGSKSYLWIQCYESPAQNFIYIQNPRWAPAIGGGDSSAISEIATDNAEGEAVFYNLQGIRVNNPANGLYIKVQGGNTSKVLVK
ncbi:MAG: hypothetical protein HDR96_02670 [Bacteroides sp.]|nr:hypothetical protein [Bacteroides sp.]